MSFNTDSFRDLTFDFLSGIARDSTKFDEMNHAYINKIHERTDLDDLRKYTRDIYEKILCKNECLCIENIHWIYCLALQTVQNNSGVQLKDCFQEKILLVYFWTFSDIHSSQMMSKMIAIDKRYSSNSVSQSNDLKNMISFTSDLGIRIFLCGFEIKEKVIVCFFFLLNLLLTVKV